MNPIYLSIEYALGKSKLHGFHLGTDERLARQLAEERFHARIAANEPTWTVALIRDGKVLACYDGKDWF